MEYLCSKCRQSKDKDHFHESPHKDRRREVTSWCKLCRSQKYFEKKYPTTCKDCEQHRPLDQNGACRRCNAKRGLRQCRVCKELLAIEFHFQGRKKVCRDCSKK